MTVLHDRSRVSVDVRADRSFVFILRVVARSIASLADLPTANIEDLELAVTDSAALLLPLASPQGQLTLHAWITGSRVLVCVTVDAADEHGSVDKSQLAWYALRRLDPAVRAIRDATTVSIELGCG